MEAASLRTALRAFDIIREGKGGAPIIDITGVLVNEVPAGFALDLMRQFHMRMVDPRRSYVQSVKAFPENIDIRFYQTWAGSMAELFKPGGRREAPPRWGSSSTQACTCYPSTLCRGVTGTTA